MSGVCIVGGHRETMNSRRVSLLLLLISTLVSLQLCLADASRLDRALTGELQEDREDCIGTTGRYGSLEQTKRQRHR